MTDANQNAAKRRAAALISSRMTSEWSFAVFQLVGLLGLLLLLFVLQYFPVIKQGVGAGATILVSILMLAFFTYNYLRHNKQDVRRKRQLELQLYKIDEPSTIDDLIKLMQEREEKSQVAQEVLSFLYIQKRRIASLSDNSSKPKLHVYSFKAKIDGLIQDFLDDLMETQEERNKSSDTAKGLSKTKSAPRLNPMAKKKA